MVPRRLINAPRLKGALALLAMAGLSACADGAAEAPDPALGPDKVAVAASRVHRLGVGDKVKLTVFGEPDLSGTFEVNAQGNVALPLVGEVPAKGLGLAEFRAAVARHLSEGFLKNPRVTADILTYRPIFVHGEVKQGGEFPFKSGLTLRDAIALAGGYTYRANERYVLLAREGESKAVRIDQPGTLQVLPGDNIRVPERFF